MFKIWTSPLIYVSANRVDEMVRRAIDLLEFVLPYSYKFSRIFAQDLNLLEIARKLVPYF